MRLRIAFEQITHAQSNAVPAFVPRPVSFTRPHRKKSFSFLSILAVCIYATSTAETIPLSNPFVLLYNGYDIMSTALHSLSRALHQKKINTYAHTCRHFSMHSSYTLSARKAPPCHAAAAAAIPTSSSQIPTTRHAARCRLG